MLNTLYLKDTWLEFGDDLTYYPSKIDFKNYDGTITTIDMLNRGYLVGSIYEGEGFKAANITTQGGYSLKFLVPNENVNVEEVFTSDNLKFLNDLNNAPFAPFDEATNTLYQTRVIFPEFETSFNENILDMLREEMGIKGLVELTTRGSTIIKDDVPHACSKVQHVAKLKVDKKGMEGAAITAIAMNGATDDLFAYKVVQQDFIVDKSFGFTLTDRSGINLFSGIVKSVK